jgi:hypothetical protein
MTQAADWFISLEQYFSSTEICTRNVSGARQKGETASLLKVVPHGIFFFSAVSSPSVGRVPDSRRYRNEQHVLPMIQPPSTLMPMLKIVAEKSRSPNKSRLIAVDIPHFLHFYLHSIALRSKTIRTMRLIPVEGNSFAFE